MNKSRKIDLLYDKAHGRGFNASAAEKKELSKYKVQTDDGDYATRSNISQYVSAVDKGYRLSFYDWCMNNRKADRRRKGSSEEEMASDNRQLGLAAAMMGWLLWGLAIYWMFDGRASVGSCAIAGAVVAVILSRINRRIAGFTLFLLPIILTVLFGAYI